MGMGMGEDGLWTFSLSLCLSHTRMLTHMLSGSVKVWDVRQKDEPVADMNPDGDVARDCWAVAFGKGQTIQGSLHYNVANSVSLCLCVSVSVCLSVSVSLSSRQLV